MLLRLVRRHTGGWTQFEQRARQTDGLDRGA
jgi:hypothetical protein